MRFINFGSVIFLVYITQTYAFFGISFKNCPESPIIKNFDPSKYAGKWYEFERFQTWFELGLSCVTANYGFVNTSYITVRNQGVYKSFNKTSTIDGVAYVKDLNEPNKLIVKFPLGLYGLTFFNTEGGYNVWDTDYNTYSLVYSCSKRSFLTIENIWILSRSKQLDQATVDRLKKLLNDKGVKTGSFVRVDQSSCNN